MYTRTLLSLLISGLVFSVPLNARCCGQLHGCDAETGVIFQVEGLYWTIYQDNLDFAVDFDDDDDDRILGRGCTHFIDYDWKGGVRGHFGLKWWGWDLQGIYTWYKNDTVKHLDGDFKASLLHPATLEVDAEKVRGESDILYQVADLLFGRDLYFCENSLVLHPCFGVRAIEIKQELKVKYSEGDFIDPIRVHWDSDLQAIGLYAGLDMDYRWWCGFGFYGSFGGSILASSTDIVHLQETLDEDGDVISQQIDIKDKEMITVPGYHLSAGMSWDGNCGQCYYYVLKIGYEFNHWFNTPQLRRYHSGNEGVSSDSSGNIGFHGGVLSFKFIF